MSKVIMIIGALIMALAVMAQEAKSAIRYIPEPVTAGQRQTVIYNSENTPLDGENQINGVVYFLRNYVWYGRDLDLKKTDTAWIATFDVPSDAALTACKFYAGSKNDTGGINTYVQFTRNTEGRNLPGAYACWGLLRAKSSRQYSIPGYYADTLIQINDDVLKFWYNQELMKNPDQRKNVWYYAAQTLDHINHNPQNPLIRADVNYILGLDSIGAASEEDLVKCISVSRRFLRNDSLAKAIERRAIEKYPDGIMAREGELFRLFRISDPDIKEKEFEQFLKRFLPEKFVNIKTENSGLYYGKMFQSVIYNRIVKHNDYLLLERYISSVPYEILPTFFRHIIEIPYRDRQMTAQQLLPHATLIMKEIFTRPRQIDQMVYSPMEWETKILGNNKSVLLAWSKILDETGSTGEAFATMQKIEPFFAAKSSDFSDFYIALLEKTGNHNRIIPVIEAGVRENAASPGMLAILKKNYTGADFEEYVNNMKEKAQIDAQKAEINKQLISMPIQLFKLVNLAGDSIDMSKMKGKIIVLDFWATWCAPCKAAMPGMQMAVDKYKTDSQVQFFFISTMETDPKYIDKIKEFLKEKDYDFEVLLDAHRSGKNKDLVYATYAAAFKFSGIPQKMIIDGNGNLRWRSTGYKGSPSALADELGFVIDMLKKESKRNLNAY